jgi:D-galactarolactone cycloisomerase
MPPGLDFEPKVQDPVSKEHPMKISDVRAYLLAIPISEKDFPAPWSWGKFNQIIVEVKTDEGVTGYGEAFGYGAPEATASVINQALRPLLLGADPADISILQDRMYRTTHFFGRYGIPTFAISGVDIALWDILGKCAGLPLCRLWGRAEARTVPAYASLVRYSDVGNLKGVLLHARNSGYRMIKLHQLEVGSVKAAREAIGGETRLALDVNCPWDPEKALEMCRELAPFSLTWLEEPIWPPEDFKSLARLGLAGGIPIAAGENACTVFQFRELLDSGAATYLQPSVVKVGGVSEFRKIAALAEAYNVKIAPHSAYFGPGLLATAHLIASSLNAVALEHLYLQLEASVFQEPLRFEKGNFLLPQKPGLGMEVNREVLRRYLAE